MLHPKSWLDSWQLKKVVSDYPVYSPPYPRNHSSLTLRQAQENFSFFTDQKERRLRRFATFLAEFETAATLDNTGVQQVGRWVHRYGAHLITSDRRECPRTYYSFNPPWIGPYQGLNVVWDLATYAGDWIIAKNPFCAWELDLGDEDRISRSLPGYLRPCVMIERIPGRFLVFDYVYDVADAKRDAIILGQIRVGDPNTLVGVFESQLRIRAAHVPTQPR